MAEKSRVVVISMENATERRMRCRERARATQLPWDFFDAHTTLLPSLTYDETDAIVAKGRPLKKGEIGCYSSHYALWESLLASDFDQYIVLEDDVIVDWPFIEEIARLGIRQFGYSYLRLMFKRPAGEYIARNAFLERSKKIVELFGTGLGTQGYVLTKEAAAVLVRYCKKVTRPIDDAMDRSWDHGVRNYSVFPFPIIEEFGQSGIGDARFERHRVPLRLKPRRVTQRVKDFVQRHQMRSVRTFQYRLVRYGLAK